MELKEKKYKYKKGDGYFTVVKISGDMVEYKSSDLCDSATHVDRAVIEHIKYFCFTEDDIKEAAKIKITDR